LNKKVFILIFIFLLCGVSSIQGQYNGGNGGGYDTTAINNAACTYALDYTLLFYAGGNGAGYDSSKIDMSTCTFSINTEFLIYAGGNGSGYDTTQISKVSCPTTINTEFLIYAGGNGSGYDTTQISKTTCPIPENSNFYLGSPITVGSSKGVISNTTANKNGPFILAAANKYAIVKGDCVELTTSGSGATSYVWTQSVGADIISSNAQNTSAKPTQNTIYTVTASGASDGCRNTGTVLIKVIDNGNTTISYPIAACNTQSTNQYQYPTIAGLTNGAFSISPSTGMTIDTKSGAIKTYSATAQVYVITYTYGSTCSNTTTASINITNNCATNDGVINYTNMYTGGLSNSVVSTNTLTTAVCAENPIIETKIFSGGLSNNVVSSINISAQTCPTNIDIRTLIYGGGFSNNVVSNNSLVLQACTYPVGDNFYLGGTGAGYNIAKKTPTTGSVTGTSVAVSADQTICPGSPITLTATGATNFTWSPATNLSNTIIANPIATPMTTTTYTVVGTGGVGCINTAKVKVTVLEDNFTKVSYGAYNFDETDMGVKKVNYIVGPLTGTFSYSPSGLFFNQETGSFTPGLSTSGVYAINYNYTKGACNYTYVSNINITTLPPSITYPAPSVFYINYAGITVTPTNTGGRAIAYEALDALPTGLTINATTGVISGTPTALIENTSIRLRAYNLNKSGGINYSDVFTMSLSVRKPIISSTNTLVETMSTTYGASSSSKTINIAGQYIIQSITVTAPTGLELSNSSNTGFANTLTLSQSGGNISSRNIYIRIKNNAAVGNITGNLVFASDAADNLTIPITTSYVAPAPLTISGKYFQKFYGSKITLGAGNSNFIATGLMNSETIGSVTITPAGGTAANDAPGLYAITPSAAMGGTFSTANYNITYTAGQFEVLYSLYGFEMSGIRANWVQGKVPIPKISGGVISLVTNNSARYTATIPTSFSNIIQRGVCWNTTINPTIGNTKIIDGATTTGNLTANLTGLTDATVYYIRTFITIGTYTYYGPNVKFVTAIGNDGSTIAKAATSGVQLHADFPALASGWYWIKSPSMTNALEMYVDMTEDGGGYDFYFITNGPDVNTVTATNGGTSLGLDLVMPRSTGHWKAMSNAVLAGIARGSSKVGSGIYASFFQTTYGVYRNTNAGNGGNSYTNKVMRSASYGGTTNAADWRVGDGGRWWLRDGTHSEPNGDYTNNGLLGLHAGGYVFPNPYDNSNIGFNDGGAYSTGLYYLVSTNTKQ
jgi:hypothetical protein